MMATTTIGVQRGDVRYGYTDTLRRNVDIYTGFQQPGGFVTYLNPINAEHVPFVFFGSAEPMRSDIYILRPCHGSATTAQQRSLRRSQ